MRLGAVILAAGAATRMGSLKQLLPYRGLTLVEHAIEQARLACFSPLVVVLGAQAEFVAQAVARTSAQWVVNKEWEAGMGSSITTGIVGILQVAPDLDGVAVLLADQPFVTSGHLKEMGRAAQDSAAPILAANYAGTLGVPAIFQRSVFGELLELPPHSGARVLLRGGLELVQSYDLPEAATDIDTPDDFAAIA